MDDILTYDEEDEELKGAKEKFLNKEGNLLYRWNG